MVLFVLRKEKREMEIHADSKKISGSKTNQT
jgi:hypothetical protein